MTAEAATAAAAGARPSPPKPEECEHPGPVLGVMAHEFSAYRQAVGPEGLRRTTMHYGPVVGGLPISAWHCEVCGLLKLDYPDGRKEERRLFPGPQPGLIAVTVAEAGAAEAGLGMQARVSGLTVPGRVYRQLAPVEPGLSIRLPALRVPGLAEAVNWLVLGGLGATILGLTVMSFGAVYDFRTPSWFGAVAAITVATFAGTVALKLSDVAFRHFVSWPRLAPSPGESLGGRPALDGVSRTIVAALVALIAGLTIAGILAVYDWKTPDLERPLVYVLIAVFVLGTILLSAGPALRAAVAGRAAATDAGDD